MGDLINPLPAVPGLEKYFVSLKSLVDHPIAPYDTVVGKNVVLQSSERQHRFIAEFALPLRKEILQLTLLKLLRYFRISPVTNFVSKDLGTLLGTGRKLHVVVLEELRLIVNPSRGLISITLTFVPTDHQSIGGALKYRKLKDPTSTTLYPSEDTILGAALDLIKPPAKLPSTTTLTFYSSGVTLEEAEKRGMDVDPLRKSIELKNIQEKTLLLRNLVAVQPVTGRPLPTVQYMGYAGIYYKLSLKAHLDDEELRKQLAYIFESIDVLTAKRSLAESIEAFDVSDDLLTLVAATEQKRRVQLVCSRVFSSTVPQQAGYLDYELHFAEQDTTWFSKREYVKKFNGISQTAFVEFLENLGAQLSKAKVTDPIARLLLPVNNYGHVVEDTYLTIINKDTLLHFFGHYLKDVLFKFKERALASSFRQQSTFLDTFKSYGPDFVRMAAPKLEAFFSGTLPGVGGYPANMSVLIASDVWGMFTGLTGNYRNIVRRLLAGRAQISATFWKEFAKVLADRLPLDFRFAAQPDMARVNDTFNLAYVEYSNRHPNADEDKIYTNELYPGMPLPSFGQLGLTEYAELLCGKPEEFGIRTLRSIKYRDTDRIPPYAFFAYEVLPLAPPSRQLLSDLKQEYRGRVYDTSLNISSKQHKQLVQGNKQVLESLESRIKSSLIQQKLQITQAAIASGQPGQTAKQAVQDYLEKIERGELKITLLFRVHQVSVPVQLQGAFGKELISRLIELEDPDEVLDERVIRSAAHYGLPIQKLTDGLEDQVLERLQKDVPRIYWSPVRLFPLFRAYIVHHFGHGLFRTAQYTALNAITSINVTMSKDAPALAMIELVDPFGLVQYALAPRKKEWQTKDGRTVVKYYPLDTSTLFQQLTGTEQINGSELLIKAGYGGHFELLETIFTGRVTESRPGPPMAIVAQGWKAELYNKTVSFYTKAKVDLPLHRHVVRLIQEGDPQGGLGEHIPEMDARLMIQQAQGRRGAWDIISRAQQHAYGAESNVQSSSRLGLDLRLLNIYYPTVEGRNIGGFFGLIRDVGKFLYDPAKQWAVPRQPIWTALQEASRHSWDMIVDVRPMDDGATIFFGTPDQKYMYTLLTKPGTEHEIQSVPQNLRSASTTLTPKESYKLLRDGNFALAYKALAAAVADRAKLPRSSIKLSKTVPSSIYKALSRQAYNSDDFGYALWDFAAHYVKYNPWKVDASGQPYAKYDWMAAADQLVTEAAKIYKALDKGASRALRGTASRTWSSRYRPFRRYYPVGSEVILSNQITATEREMANSIRVHYPKVSQFGFISSVFYDRSDEFTLLPSTEWLSFPPPDTRIERFRTPGLSWQPDNLMSVQLLKTVSEINAHTEYEACKLAITNLARHMRTMYRGELVLTGHYFWPWDILAVYDTTTTIKGPIEVDRVVHLYDPQKGWVSTVTPHLITQANNNTTLLTYAGYDEAFAYLMQGIDIFFDVWTAVSLIATLGSGIAITGLKESLKKVLQGAASKEAKDLLGQLVLTSAKLPGSVLLNAVTLGKAKKEILSTGLKEIVLSAGKKVLTKDFLAGRAAQLGKWAIGRWMRNIAWKTLLHHTTQVGGVLLSPLLYGDSLESLPVHAVPLVKDGAPYVAGLNSAPLLYSAPDLSRSLAGLQDQIEQVLFALSDIFRTSPTPGSTSQFGTKK